MKCERGTVLSGRLGTVVDGKEMVFEAGEEFAFPAGPMHTWWNAGDELLEVDGIAYPAVDLDRNLQAMFAVLNAGKPEGHRPFMRPTSRTATVRPQYAAVIPKPVQRLLFPVLVAYHRVPDG